MKNQKFKSKLMLVFTTLIFLVCAMVYSISSLVLFRIQKADALDRLETISNLGYSYLDLTYKGHWRLDGENLYKGDVLINGNYKVVDEIKNKTGAFVTIFQKDKRVATNVLKEDGSRAVGTTVAQNVAEVLLKKGEEYKGIASVVEKNCESIYKPLKNENGEVIGIWFVGVTQESIKQKINQNIMKFNTAVILITFICIFISIFAVDFFTRKNVRGIESLLKTMKNVEENGDLTSMVNISNKDEIGEVAKGLNNMLVKLNTIFKQVSVSSDVVLKSSRRMGEITEDIDKLSKQQYSSVEETRESMGELDGGMQNITNGIQEVTHSVAEVAKLFGDMKNGVEDISMSILQLNSEALNTLSATDDGKKAVERSKAGMDIINSSVGNLIEIVNGLGESAGFIGEIVNVIDDISEQTNLLALNAAIEAARAGEYGRGFSVVAESISNLSEKSGEATKEITKLVREVQERLKMAVQASKKGAIEIEKGVSSASETQKAFHKIEEAFEIVEVEIKKVCIKTDEQVTSIRKGVDVADKVKVLAQNMAKTVESQTISSTGVVKSVERISESANQIVIGTEDIAKQTENLEEEAKKLSEIVYEFKINEA